MTSDRAAFVALALTPGIGIARLHSLLSACSTPLGAFSAPFEFLCTIPGIGRAAATAIKERSPADGEVAIVAAERLGAVVLDAQDPHFPECLRDIPDAPPLLFALGRVELLGSPAAAVVGSRDHTRYGAEVCRAVAGAAASRGITVVSGMARGLDAIAHQAALDARGNTIGVLGNGLGVIYPAANRKLYERVAKEGLLVTEFPPGERPHAGSFPRRNRLISGLARVSVVIEAAIGSGALITAGTALDQGRDVMAVPGPITSAASAGANSLIRDGAEPLLAPQDLLAHYPEAVPAAALSASSEWPDLAMASDAARRVANAVGDATSSIDRLTHDTGLPVSELLAALSELESLGVVTQNPGGRFSLANQEPRFPAATRM